MAANNFGLTDFSSLFNFNGGGLSNITQNPSYNVGGLGDMGSLGSSGNPATSGFGSLFPNLNLGDVFSRNSLFGGLDEKGNATGGWVSPLAALGSTLFGAVQGQKQMKLAQDSFDESKRQFQLNYDAQKQSTNTQLEDRQRARVASNPGAYESVDSYVSRNRIN
jgi:hypothetical protein